LFVTNFTGITFSAILIFFLLGLKHRRSSKWFYKGTMATIFLGAIIMLPLALNYNKFNSGIQFQSSIYEKAGTI